MSFNKEIYVNFQLIDSSHQPKITILDNKISVKSI